MRKETIRNIAISSMMAALSVALDLLFSIRGDTSKYTIYALPLLLSGLLFGPRIGAYSGFTQGFLIQFLTFGLTPTTLLWVIAPTAWGFISGLLTSKDKKTPVSVRRLVFIVFFASLCCLCINTLALILDALIVGYSYAYVFSTFLMRLIVSIGVAVFYCLMLAWIYPRLVHILAKPTTN